MIFQQRISLILIHTPAIYYRSYIVELIRQLNYLVMKHLKNFTVLLFSIASVIVSMTGCGGSDNSDSLDYIAVKTSEDAKWGFVGPDGKMLYEEEFEKEPSPVINGFFIVEENNGISVYKADAKKPELVPGCEDLVYAGIMSEGLIPVTRKNERIKLVNASGVEKLTLMPVDGKEIINVSHIVSDGTLPFITADNKCGLLSTSGKVLIPAKYKMLVYAGEGMVFAEAEGAADSLGNIKKNVYLLDKNGKEIKKFEEEMYPHSKFVKGKALFMKRDDNIPGYIDKKGEFTKLPGKVHGFGDFFNGKEFAFTTEDNKTGLMTLEGEILIRPKYEYLGSYSKDKFYVKDDDKKWSILSKEGEKEKTYDDFKYFLSIPQLLNNTKFEVLAGEKEHRFDFYSFDGKSLTQESFYAVNLDFDTDPVYTDYFNAEEVGDKMVSLLDKNGVNGIAFGTGIRKILPKDAVAKAYSDTYAYEFPDISGGYRWTLKAVAETNEPIASPIHGTKTENYGYYTYTHQVITGYQFNNAKVSGFSISVSSYKDFQEKTADAVISALEKRGFKQYEQDEEGESIAAFTNGVMNVNLSIYSEGGKTTLTMNVYPKD